MKENEYVIGIDFGTDSVRATIVNAVEGCEVSTSAADYKRWMKGKYCDPVINQFRQHPRDYIEGLQEVVVNSLSKAPKQVKENIRGISIDTTGSTPCAVDKEGTPLSLKPEFSDNPDAMFVLWKDHTAVQEAREINGLSKTWGNIDYTKYEGGIYSSEWFWAKILHVLRNDEAVRNAAYSWIEHCDWIPAVLTGCNNILKVKRSRCAAGHKAMWHPSFDGLPAEAFLTKLDPLLKGIRERLFHDTYTSNEKAGYLSDEWAKRLGLNPGVAVGVGAFDAHMGAVGGGIRPYVLSKVMGTSTCDMVIVPLADIKEKLVSGICGQVEGSIVPGMIGLEAGQSAFGDIYAWFKQLLLWPYENILKEKNIIPDKERQAIAKTLEDSLISELSIQAEKLNDDADDIITLDWHNGRRTPDANQALKGAVTGLNLGSGAPRIFRALVEGTAFGAKKIVDRFQEQGIEIREVIALGGVAKKSPFIMQVVSDVLEKKIKVARSEQACALGAAMFAAAASGIYPTVEQAQSAMESGFEKEYLPNHAKAPKYRKKFRQYSALGEFIEKQIAEDQRNGGI